MRAQGPSFNVLVCDMEASRQLLSVCTALTRTEGELVLLCLWLGARESVCALSPACRRGGQRGVGGFPLFLHLCFGPVRMAALDRTAFEGLIDCVNVYLASARSRVT